MFNIMSLLFLWIVASRGTHAHSDDHTQAPLVTWNEDAHRIFPNEVTINRGEVIINARTAIAERTLDTRQWEEATKAISENIKTHNNHCFIYDKLLKMAHGLTLLPKFHDYGINMHHTRHMEHCNLHGEDLPEIRSQQDQNEFSDLMRKTGLSIAVAGIYQPSWDANWYSNPSFITNGDKVHLQV